MLPYVGLEIHFEANVGVGFGKSMGTILFPNPKLPMGWNSELPTVAKEIQPLGSELFGEVVGLT